MTRLMHAARLVLAAAIALTFAVAAYGEAPESKRLAQAKDFIAEEQWTRAIEELRAAAADPKETRRDEALYWLAHSLNQTGDSASALETIRRLEREFPASLWVKPAGALRIEMAVRLRRDDVLWWMVSPRPVARPAPAPPVPPAPVRTPASKGQPAPPAPAPSPAPAPAPVWDPAAPPIPMPSPAPQTVWLSEASRPDPDLRIQALNYLIRTDAEKAIPWLRQIALEQDNPVQASRAVFVLAQSDRPEARETVVHVARAGAEPVRIAAVRELGRFGGPDVSKELLQVYSTADMPVKLQVVRSLGERAERQALLLIAQSEADRELRQRAVVALGRAGGSEQLRLLYARATPEMKRPIIIGLFNARAEDELIRIADRESDPTLRREVLDQLRLLGTPKAKAYLQKVSGNR